LFIAAAIKIGKSADQIGARWKLSLARQGASGEK